MLHTIKNRLFSTFRTNKHLNFSGAYRFLVKAMPRLKSTLLVRKMFDFKDYKLHDVEIDEEHEDAITVFLDRARKTANCPVCGRRCSNIESTYMRRVRDLNIGTLKCFIAFRECKVRCACGYRGIEKLNFVDKYSHCTKRFEDYVSRLCQLMSLSDAASVAEIDWKTARHIDKKYLNHLVSDLKSISPTRLGVDEVAYQKRHKYLTVVRDLTIERVIWVGIGRKKTTLDGFFKELDKAKCSMIEVVVMDMWDPYIASTRENTNAKIVFDKFHIAKKINEAVDKVRKQEFAKADAETQKKFKKKRFIILKRGKDLDDKKRETLDELMRESKTLYQAYLLKEQVLDVFDEKDEKIALSRLDRWFENVEKSGLQQFKAVVKTIRSYFYGVVNYFKYRLTNAASEAFNNKINVIKRRAYGFHDIEYFKLKILQSCG